MGGKEVEWTLGFVLAEVGAPVPPTTDAACIDSCLIGEHPPHHLTTAHEGARFNADFAQAQTELPPKRAPAISQEDALRYIELANEFIAAMETTVHHWIEQVHTIKEQYVSACKQYGLM